MNAYGKFINEIIINMGFCVSVFCRFATLESSGLLFYNGRFNEKHDFITLEIQEGQVVLKYSTGTISISISICISISISIYAVQHSTAW